MNNNMSKGIVPLHEETPSHAHLLSARARIEGSIHQTPLFQSSWINELLGGQVFFKAENLQKTGAFKSRGATNAVFQLPSSQASQGVCTHSSGNHAQALARAATLRGIPAHIVMPRTAPTVKVNAVKAYGGQIYFCEPTLKDRERELSNLIAQTGAVPIHPYNNTHVIAGQSTMAQEIKEQLSTEPHYIVCPVGGGGLISGTALAVKYFFQNTQVVAAEPQGANDAYQSFMEKKLIPQTNPQTIADGLLTSLGSITFPVIVNMVKQVVCVSDQYIFNAMKTIWERLKLVSEPSGSVALAALLEGKINIKNKTVVVVISGGNMDINSLMKL